MSFPKLCSLLLIAVFCLAPQSVDAQSSSKRNSKKTYMHIDSDRGYSLEVEMRGDVEVSDDDREITYVSDGGYVEIEEEKRGQRHQLRVEGEAGGQLAFRYRRGGKRMDFDREGQAWLGETLLTVIREAGLAAEQRTLRILKQEGANGVLKEVSEIENGSSKIRYMTHLFDQAKLNTSQLVHAARLAEEVPSPGDKTRLLMQIAPNYMGGGEATTAFFNAAGTIGSPGDKTRLLIHLVDEKILRSDAAYLEALAVAKGIGSPGDRSRFLMKAAPAYMPKAKDAYFEAVNGIGSPGDHARVLIYLIEESKLDKASVQSALLSARSIGSPGDKVRVLGRVSRQAASDASLGLTYLKVASSIGASGDQSRSLIKLLEAGDLDRSVLIALLNTVNHIGAPGDMTRVLLAASDQVAGDDELTEAYIKAAEAIGPSGDQKRALAALLD